MNLKTTFLLLLLVAAGVAAYYYQDTLAAKLGIAKPAAGANSPTLDVIEASHSFRSDALQRIEVAHDGARVEFVRSGQAWNLPGGWPTRGPEVQELVGIISGLDTRFAPIPVTDADMKSYGLDKLQNPVEVTVAVDFPGPEKTKTHKLLFGESPDHAGNRFTRPTYVRLDNQPEVLRAAPGLLAVLTRPADAYRKRQLFPEVKSLRFADARPTFPGDPDSPSPPVALLDAKSVTTTGPDGAWTVRRTTPPMPSGAKPPTDLTVERFAERWELAAPVTDRLDPDRLKGVLTAMPELWVENFVADVDPAKTGLGKPERTIEVEFDNRGPMKLLIGQVSRVVDRPAAAPPPPPNPFGPPPPPPLPPVREEYRYAKLPDNPQVFEVRSDKLADLFLAPSSLRDARLFRFRPGDVQRVEIARAEGRVVLAKEKDDATKEERWKLVEPIKSDAEAPKVTELIDRLGDMLASGPDVLDKADAKALGLDPAADGPKLTLTVTEETPGPPDAKDKPTQTRTLTLRVGKHDEDKKKVNVQVAGNQRIDVVADDFLKLFDRPALAYRGRRVLDIPTGQVTSVSVQRGGEQFQFNRVDGNWKMAQPANASVDNGKVGQLTDDLRRLEAVEYVNDAPKPDELANYGLNQPTLAVTLSFADAAQPPKTVQIGKAREGKPEVYAKLADNPAVFVLRDSIKTTIDQPSLAYRPLQLWQLGVDSVTAVEVQRGDDKYRVSRDGTAWKVSGPFDAPAAAATVQPLVGQLTAPRVERYEAHTADDAAKYGFDKPEMRLTVYAAGEPGPKSLIIGKPVAADRGSRYAKMSDDNAVVVVPESLVQVADRPALALLDRQLLSLNSNLIQQVRGSGPDGAWDLKRSDGDWQIASANPPIAADRPAADAVVRLWANVQASNFAAYGPQTDFAKYGLDKPVATVTVSLTPEEGRPPAEHTLALGQKVEGSEAVYVRVDNGPGVAVLPASVAHELTHSQLDFVDRKLLAFDPSDLTAIRRKEGANEMELTRTDDGWQVTKPAPHKADQQGMDDLAERLAGLRAARVAALDATDVKPFGLDTPTATVTLVLKDKDGKPVEKVVQVGGVAPPRAGAVPAGEERFARVEGSNKIAVLPAAISKRLVAEPLKFHDRAIARFADADRVIVERTDRKAIFAKLDGTWKMTEPLMNAEAEQTELDDLINALARLRADELVADKPTDLTAYGLDKPEANWHFLAGDREVLHLLVGKRDPASGRNFAKLADGDVVFFLDPGLSNRLVAEYRKRSLWTNLDAAQVDTLVYNVGGETLVLQKLDNAWQVAGKPDQKVKSDVVGDMLAALAFLKIERYVVDKGADLKLYGLQTPVRTIVARTRTGTTATLYLGNAEGGSTRVYGRVLEAGRSDVFVLSEADSAKLVREVKDFLGN